MSTITTRAAKGSALTHAEVDANFTNLNSGKAEVSGQTFTGAVVLPAGSATAGGVQVGTGSTYKPSIYSPGTDQLAISTGGTGRLFVDASGNVGVGQTSITAVFGRTVSTTGTAAATYRVAGATTSAYLFTSDGLGCGGIYQETNHPLIFGTNSTERLRVTAAGLVGIGTSSPGSKLDVISDSTSVVPGSFNSKGAANSTTYGIGNALLLGSNDAIANNTVRIDFYSNNNSSAYTGAYMGIVAGTTVNGPANIVFGQRTGTATTQERCRIDDSGRLLVGTSTARGVGSSTNGIVQVETTSYIGYTLVNNTNDGGGSAIVLGKSRGTSAGSNTVVQSGDDLGSIIFAGADGTNLQSQAASIKCSVDATPGSGDMPGRLVFSTTADGAASPTERMRIGNGGSTSLFSSNNIGLDVSSSLAAGTTDYVLRGRYGASGNTGGTASFQVFTNGNAQNTNNSYGAISDLKLKENIVDAGSQWSDLKSLQVRNYNFKEGQTHTQIGLVAQEAELVSPGLVYENTDRDEDGNDLGTVTKSVNYSVLYMKAVKALQEAMERIEALEADVAQLKGA
jgi:hypothetical protein